MKENYLRKMSVIFTLIFVSILSALNVQSQNMFRKVNDFDGDGKADFAVTRNENGSKFWYVWKSTTGFSAFQFGLDTDENAPGDYDGDGKTDYAVYRKVPVPNSSDIANQFYIYQSQTGTLNGIQFFQGDTRPYHAFQQDYDGDGKTEPAINSYYGLSSTVDSVVNIYRNGILIQKRYPSSDLAAKTGDMTGDGKADVVSRRQSDSLVTIKNSATDQTQLLYFGTTGDQYVPADFDGDGKGDLALFRESDGNWWWLRSSDSSVQGANWGITGDLPVPADYDGDGKTDLAIWRRGNYWIYQSQSGIRVFNWGLSTDSLVTY